MKTEDSVFGVTGAPSHAQAQRQPSPFVPPAQVERTSHRHAQWPRLPPRQARSAPSKAEYRRLTGEWRASKGAPISNAGCDLSVSELVLAFCRHAQSYYRRPDGTQTSEVSIYKSVLRLLRRAYGHTPAKDFGPLCLIIFILYGAALLGVVGYWIAFEISHRWRVRQRERMTAWQRRVRAGTGAGV